MAEEKRKTVIVTGASQGIGAELVGQFLKRGYNVVGTSRSISKSPNISTSDNLALVDGDIGVETTARKVADTAVERFGSIDALVANAGTIISKPFTEYSADDFRLLVSVNLEGFLYIAQLAVRQMLIQKTGGSVTSVTTSLVANPFIGVPGSVLVLTKGGVEAAIRSLANEYAKDRIRFNAVSPGVVDTPLQKSRPKEFLKTRSPMGVIASVKDISDAVVYLTEAETVTGEVLHVDGGAHSGKW